MLAVTRFLLVVQHEQHNHCKEKSPTYWLGILTHWQLGSDKSHVSLAGSIVAKGFQWMGKMGSDSILFMVLLCRCHSGQHQGVGKSYTGQRPAATHAHIHGWDSLWIFSTNDSWACSMCYHRNMLTVLHSWRSYTFFCEQCLQYISIGGNGSMSFFATNGYAWTMGASQIGIPSFEFAQASLVSN